MKSYLMQGEARQWIGKAGETDGVRLLENVTDWLARWPDGEAGMTFVRPDGGSYTLEPGTSGGITTADLTSDCLTYPGECEVTTTWTVSGAVVASRKHICKLAAEGQKPEPYASVESGIGSRALADGAHAEGLLTAALGRFSHTFGEGTVASGDDEIVFGRYNDPDDSGMFALEFGIGQDDANRSTGLAMDWEGNLYLAGDLRILNGENSIADGISMLYSWLYYETMLEVLALPITLNDPAGQIDIYYHKGWWTADMVGDAVTATVITQDEADEILAEDEDEGEGE